MSQPVSPAPDERPVEVTTAGGPVPAVLWQPADPPHAPPLVLLGHGGSGHKRSPRNLRLARWFTAEGFAVLAIDGPWHGDRVPAPVPAPVYQRLAGEQGAETVLDRMVGDWHAAIDAVTAAGLADPDRLAYLGMSMGARYGLALAASLGDRLRCLVFGKFGVDQAPELDPRLRLSERVERDARAITAPTLFHLQWQDEVFPRQGQLTLFDWLAAADKLLLGYPGGHGDTPADALPRWCEFVRQRL